MCHKQDPPRALSGTICAPPQAQPVNKMIRIGQKMAVQVCECSQIRAATRVAKKASNAAQHKSDDSVDSVG